MGVRFYLDFKLPLSEGGMNAFRVSERGTTQSQLRPTVNPQSAACLGLRPLSAPPFWKGFQSAMPRFP